MALALATPLRGLLALAHVVSAARHAFVHGWSTSMWIGAAGMFLLLLFLPVRAPHPAISALPTPDQQDPS